MSDAWNHACHIVAFHQLHELPEVISRSTTPENDIADLPLKPVQGSTKIKSAVEKVVFHLENQEQMESITAMVRDQEYRRLPEPLAVKGDLPLPFTLQLIFRKVSENKYDVIKHFRFAQKVDVRLLEAISSGDLFLVDYGKNFRAGSAAFQYVLERAGHFAILAFHFTPKPTKNKEKSSLEKGFAYIKSDGPKSNMNNLRGAEIEVNREDSPIYGWSAGLVKESLKGDASANVFARPTKNFFLTIHDLSAWFLKDILLPLLGDMKSKTLVFLGITLEPERPQLLQQLQWLSLNIDCFEVKTRKTNNQAFV